MGARRALGRNNKPCPQGEGEGGSLRRLPTRAGSTLEPAAGLRMALQHPWWPGCLPRSLQGPTALRHQCLPPWCHAEPSPPTGPLHRNPCQDRSSHTATCSLCCRLCSDGDRPLPDGPLAPHVPVPSPGTLPGMRQALSPCQLDSYLDSLWLWSAGPSGPSKHLRGVSRAAFFAAFAA